MWKWIKWTAILIVALVVGLFLHYTLPKHDVVYVTRTFNQLTQIGSNHWFYASPDSGTTEDPTITRDIRFIDAVHADGSVIVFRNEDTGWIWPPYFKYDSSNLQAEATNLVSTKAKPDWAMVTYYGWRIPLISIYPNAVSIRAVDGPDATVIPWVTILVLVLLAWALWMIRRIWMQFRERAVDPAMAEVGEAIDRADQHKDAAVAQARGTWSRLVAWLKGTPRR